MIYVPITLVREGMIPVHNIPDALHKDEFLVEANHQLTTSDLDKLRAAGVAGCYIKSGDTSSEVVCDCNSLALHSASLDGVYDALHSASKETIANVVNCALDNTDALGNIQDIRSYDTCTYEHSLRVMLMSVLIGRELKLSEEDLNKLATSAVLHDIGKLDIPQEILNKDARLNPYEREVIEQHTVLGYKHATDMYDFDRYVTDGILYHHERANGSGYPAGLKADEIPLCAKIIAVADVFDALTSKRPYRDPWFPNEAIIYMSKEYCDHFDKNVFNAFLKVVVPYPVGTAVLLSDGTVAFVASLNKNNCLRPALRRLPDMQYIDLCDKKYWNLTIRGVCYNEIFMDALQQGGNILC